MSKLWQRHGICSLYSMKNTQLHEKWETVKEELLKKHPHLTEEDLVLEIGKEEETLKRLQKKLGANWEEWKNILSIMG